MENGRPSESSTSGSSLLSEEKNCRRSGHRHVDNRIRASHMRPKIIAAVLVLLLVVSLIVNVVLIVFTLIKTIQSSQQGGDASRDTTSQPEHEAQTPVCVPCSDLGLSSSPSVPSAVMVEVVEVKDGKEKLCCQRYPPYLNKLIKMLLEKSWRDDGGQGYRTLPSANSDVSMPLPPGPSAHLYLASPPSLHSNSSDSGLHWTKELGYGTAHFHGNVILDKETGGLRVPKSGVYFLYSFLSVRPWEGKKFPLAHYVSRKHPQLPNLGSQELLLDKMYGEGETTRSSFLCANLMLREGDIITVGISNVSRLRDSWHSSFMGLHLLG